MPAYAAQYFTILYTVKKILIAALRNMELLKARPGRSTASSFNGIRGIIVARGAREFNQAVGSSLRVAYDVKASCEHSV